MPADHATPATLRELHRPELAAAARLLGHGMCENPVHIQAFGPDREHRARAVARFFAPVLRGLYQRGSILGAFRGLTLVGVCGIAPPGRCQPGAGEKLSILPAVLFGNALGTSSRVKRWVGEWSRRDPAEPHWHLGPVAVDPDVQRQGIGGAMMNDFCGRMDDRAALSYLETDKSENVRFYQKFGFAVVAEAEVLGVRNWFMSRPPRSGAPAA